VGQSIAGFLLEHHLPISGANVPSIIGWDTTAINDDAQNHETDAAYDFDCAENELNLAKSADPVIWRVQVGSYLSIAFDSKVLDDGEKEE
jgi:hypothetical protein